VLAQRGCSISIDKVMRITKKKIKKENKASGKLPSRTGSVNECENIQNNMD
jgi:hypothetical protein